MEKAFAIYMPGRTLRLVITSWAAKRSGHAMRLVTGTWERLDGPAALGEPRWDACGALSYDVGKGHRGPPPVGAVLVSLLAVLGRQDDGAYTQASLEAGALRVEGLLDARDFLPAFQADPRT
jgi:hypothetical protein